MESDPEPKPPSKYGSGSTYLRRHRLRNTSKIKITPTGILLGDKSRVLDIEHPGDEFPLFQEATSYTAELQPGDVLFIPAFWFHNMKVSTCSIL